MVVGLVLGRVVTGLDDALAAIEIGSVSLPIAIGLLVMMYPVLAKVRYDEIGRVTGDRRLLVASIVLNWVVGPALMFALAWLLLPDLPDYRTGLIIVGLARCIAMVLIWNDLACGDREAAAVLVAINAVFQILAFALLGYFYLEVLPGWLGLEQTALDVSVWEIALSVLIFLGIPLAAGFLTRTLGERAKGREWYESRVLPAIGPWALYGLLFTIVILFALQGDTITNEPLDVARIAVPLLAYFALMWTGSMLLSKAMGLDYERATAVSFTAAGNNFELAIAVAIGVFGVTSGQALAGVVGPLIEVPALVALVYVSLWARRFFTVRANEGVVVMTQPPTGAGPAGRLRLRAQRRSLGDQPRADRALRAGSGRRALGRHPARRAHPRRGRRGAGEARPRHLARDPDAADARDDRRLDDGHHARLRRGVPLRPRRAVRRLAGRRSRWSGRGDRPGDHRRPRRPGAHAPGRAGARPGAAPVRHPSLIWRVPCPFPDHPGITLDQEVALKAAATRLAREFDGTFGEATIERFLHSSLRRVRRRRGRGELLAVAGRTLRPPAARRPGAGRGAGR